MSWQEDLQQLDTALAGGQISADDYRRRRDEVLAKASGGNPPTPAPEAQPPQPAAPEPQQPAPGDAQQSQHGHFPPPFRWQSTAPPVSSVDATQTMRPVGQDADRTQVVSGDRTQVVPDNQSADRTQVVRGAPGQQGPNSGGFPAQYYPQQQGDPAGGWPQQKPMQQPDTSAPWAGSEFPPLGSPGNWAIKQGPEVFGNSSASGGRRGLVAALVVVVVVLLGVGAYFLFFSGSGKSTNQANPPAVTTTAPKPPPKPKDDLEIGTLPGTRQDQSGISSFTDVVNGGLLTNGENQAYETAGASGARLATSTLPGPMHLQVLTVRTSSASAAGTAVASLVTLQSTYAFTPYTGTTPPGVRIEAIAAGPGHPATIRAHYAHNRTVVRVQVDGADLNSISTAFGQILAKQLTVLSADG